MERQIDHACGHPQTHYLAGFAAEQDRKAQWLARTKCRACFITEKRSTEAAAAADAAAALAHLLLPPLAGTDRQIAWASGIRSRRLAAMPAMLDPAAAVGETHWYRISDAKWWIDHRDHSDDDLRDCAFAAQRPDGR